MDILYNTAPSMSLFIIIYISNSFHPQKVNKITPEMLPAMIIQVCDKNVPALLIMAPGTGKTFAIGTLD